MKKMVLLASLLGCLFLPGCAATVGTGGAFYVPKDAAATCTAHCAEIGLSLDSVVIMANNIGCVCRGAKGAAQNNDGGSTAGGMAALIVQEEQRRNQQQQRR